MSEKSSAFRRFADKLAVDSDSGLTQAQLMVRYLASRTPQRVHDTRHAWLAHLFAVQLLTSTTLS